jgi:hypothetical protein
MPDPIDLGGPVQEALDGAVLRGHPPALAYVREDGSLAATFRGSTHVHSPTELALWIRKRDDGFAKAITKGSRVSLVYADFGGPGARYVAIEGRASTRPELNDEVYQAIVQPERQQDPEKGHSGCHRGLLSAGIRRLRVLRTARQLSAGVRSYAVAQLHAWSPPDVDPPSSLRRLRGARERSSLSGLRRCAGPCVRASDERRVPTAVGG